MISRSTGFCHQSINKVHYNPCCERQVWSYWQCSSFSAVIRLERTNVACCTVGQNVHSRPPLCRLLHFARQSPLECNCCFVNGYGTVRHKILQAFFSYTVKNILHLLHLASSGYTQGFLYLTEGAGSRFSQLWTHYIVDPLKSKPSVCEVFAAMRWFRPSLYWVLGLIHLGLLTYCQEIT